MVENVDVFNILDFRKNNIQKEKIMDPQQSVHLLIQYVYLHIALVAKIP